MIYPSILSVPELAVHEIHIWSAALNQLDSSLSKFIQTLSIDERIRAARFHFDRDRNHFIVKRGILRTILGSYLNVEANRLQFCFGKNGKPSLADALGNKTIGFNVSHSNGIALFAFVRDYEIGVDIERIRDIPEMDEIVEQFFSPKENAVFRSLPESEKKEAFFNCWVRKEAFIKAIGDGLYYPLDKFEVSLVAEQPANLVSIKEDSRAASRWSIQELKLSSGFAAAFAIEERSCKFHYWQWAE